MFSLHGRLWSHIKQEHLPRMPLTHLTFQSEPSPRLSSLQLYLSPFISPSIFLSPAFSRSNSRLPLFKHLFPPPHPPFFFSFYLLLIPFTDILCHHFLISLNIHQVNFNQHELLFLPCNIKWMHCISSKISVNDFYIHPCTRLRGCTACYCCCLFLVD